MITTSWTENEIRKSFIGCATLREIISEIESDFSRRGEVICEIHVNGVRLDEADESRFASSPSAEIRSLEVRGDRPDALIGDALGSALQLLPQLEQSCVSTAEKFRGPSIVEAQKGFTETLDGCQWLIETMMHVRGASSGIGDPIPRTDLWLDADQAIARVVKEVSAAYMSRDFVLVADLLEYELTGALAVWRTVVSSECRRREGGETGDEF